MIRYLALLAAAAGMYLPPADLWGPRWPRKPFGPERGLVQEEWTRDGKVFAHSTTWFERHGAKLCMVVHSPQYPGKPRVNLVIDKNAWWLQRDGQIMRDRLESPFASGGRIDPFHDEEGDHPPAPIAGMTVLGRATVGVEAKHLDTTRVWFWQEIPLRAEVVERRHHKIFEATELRLDDPPEPAECIEAERLISEH